MPNQTKIEWTDFTGRQLGAFKVAAKKLGVTFDEYKTLRDSGKKHCQKCRQWLEVVAFGADLTRYDSLAASCIECSLARGRSAYTPIPPDQQMPKGPAPHPARDGDRKQARQRVNVLVRSGGLPHPNDLPCTDCGHVHTSRSCRHEYDHHLGYSAEHHLSVQSVCTACHGRRERERGTYAAVAASNSRRHVNG